MIRFIEFLEQLECCFSIVKNGSSSGNRLTIIVIDSILEIQLINTIDNIQQNWGNTLTKRKLNPCNLRFNDKINFIWENKSISHDLKQILISLHDLRVQFLHRNNNKIIPISLTNIYLYFLIKFFEAVFTIQITCKLSDIEDYVFSENEAPYLIDYIKKNFVYYPDEDEYIFNIYDFCSNREIYFDLEIMKDEFIDYLVFLLKDCEQLIYYIYKKTGIHKDNKIIATAKKRPLVYAYEDERLPLTNTALSKYLKRIYNLSNIKSFEELHLKFSGLQIELLDINENLNFYFEYLNYLSDPY